MTGTRILEDETYDSLLEVEVYGEVVSRYWAFSHSWIVEQALNFGTPGTVLDIGAGTGHIAVELAQHNVFDRIVAVDSSPLMLQVAQEKAQRVGCGGKIEFVEADATDLPFPDDHFDTVLCHNTLHHMADPKSFLAEIMRVTKPDGQFFIRDMHRPHWVVVALMEYLVFPFAGSSRKQSVDSLKAALSIKELRELAAAFPGLQAVRKGIVHVSLQKSVRRLPRKPYIALSSWWLRPWSRIKV